MTQKDQQTQDTFFGTKEFKSRFSLGASTQALWRKKGMPHYKVPNSTKILYKEEEISQKEYLWRIKPIDAEIGRLEMATLQDTLVWKESLLAHTPKLKR